MSILIGNDTRLVVQGITGREGQFHARQMIDYGTKVVAGETPGRGGMEVAGVPVYDTVAQAVKERGANTSIVYVPAAYASDAILEAVDAGIKLVVCITEGIPTLDMIEVVNYLDRNGARLIGPNCPGLISPGQSKVGIIPGHICMPGPVGIVSRSGTLTYEVIWELTLRQIGQSTCVGIGGDPVIGTKFVDVLKLFQDDPQTEQIVMIGEIGGTDEEEAADFIAKYVTKPVVGFIAGQTAPPGKRMGHAGAIISGGTGTAQEKIAAMQQAGIRVGSQPAELAALIAEIRQTGGEAGTKAARRKSKAPSPGLKPK